MTLTLVATVGAADANSYATAATADTYFEAHPSWTTWDALTTPAKERALIHATTLIDMEPIDGDKYDISTTSGVPDQARRFPRTCDYIDGTKVLPPAVLVAAYEQALELSVAGAIGTRQTLQQAGVVEVQIGNVRERYSEDAGPSPTHLSTKARALLMNAGLLAVAGSWA